MDFYTPSEVAKILGVPQRRVLGWSDAGEIEAERSKGFRRRLFGG
jgi:excisionase family DNA binding protein